MIWRAWLLSLLGGGCTGRTEPVSTKDEGSSLPTADETGRPTETGQPTPEAPGRARWATTIGGPGADRVLSVAVLSDGAIAASGVGADALRLDAGLPTETILSGSDPQAWWAVWEPTGQLRLAASAAAGPGESGRAEGIVQGEGGDVYVVGTIEGTATFGDQVLASPGERALFLARYTAADGDLIWLRGAPCGGACRIESIEAFQDGSLLIGGAFTDSLILGPGEPRQAVLRAVGGTEDGFIAHYTAAGAILTGLHFPSEGGSRIPSMARESTGNILAAVSFSGRTTLGRPGDRGRVVLDEPTEGSQVAVTRYLLDASLDAVLPLSGAGDDRAGALYALDDGGFVLSGSFSDALTGEGVSLQSTGGVDAFWLRYSAAWGLVGADQVGGPSDESGLSVAARPDGGLWIAGALCGAPGPCDATAGVGSDAPLSIAGPQDAAGFVGVLGSSGDPGWAWTLGGGPSALVGLEIEPTGAGVIAGSFEGELILDADTSDQRAWISQGGADGVIVSIEP